LSAHRKQTLRELARSTFRSAAGDVTRDARDEQSVEKAVVGGPNLLNKECSNKLLDAPNSERNEEERLEELMEAHAGDKVDEALGALEGDVDIVRSGISGDCLAAVTS